MILQSPDPLSEEDTILMLQNYFHELQSAQIDFEELWYASGQGERSPDPQALKQLLRRISGRADLMEVAFVWLRMLQSDSQRAQRSESKPMKPMMTAKPTKRATNHPASHAPNP